MNKKGFTLVELLAVIVILAIIALIAIPLIGNVIEKAKIGALESSANGLIESVNMYYANEMIKGENISNTIFDFEGETQISNEKLEYKGKVYNGKLIVHANGEVAVCIDDKEHYAYKNKDVDEIISGVGTCVYDGTTGNFSSNSPVEDLKQQIEAATATSDKVLEGNTIYTSVGLVAGTMTNKAGTTTTANTLTQSGTNALITIPANGYYDTSSKISVPITTIQSGVSSLNNNYTLVHTYAGSDGSTFTLNRDYKALIIVLTYTSDNNNPLDWGLTTTGSGTISHLNQQYTWQGNGVNQLHGTTTYLVTNAKAGDSFTYRYHYSGTCVVAGVF